MLVTPDQPRRRLSVVLERIARRICAAHNECDPYDGYTNKHWPAFLVGARAAYLEMLEIDSNQPTQTMEKEPYGNAA